MARPRLAACLDASLGYRLTVLAAPSGFGKTTLLAAWSRSRAVRDVPFAWVSLDAGDNDPIPFWSYLCAALEAARRRRPRPRLASLQTPRPPSNDVLLRGLTSLTDPIVLVLDDYQTIAAAPIHQALAILLDHLSPHLHLVIASRADPPLPLARLRARGELGELRAADLRFTAAETRALLADVRGLSLAAEDVDLLTVRTEGWIAAKWLAALSLHERPDVSGFVRAVGGRYRSLVDFLADEVLDRLPTDGQTFLRQTAILDRLSEPLCDALTGRADGQAQLEALAQADLFTVPFDEERRWYRYHHLFAKFLRAHASKTAPDEIAPLHQRAAAWYANEGLLTEAVGHAFAAHDDEAATRLVERAIDPTWLRGELTTLHGWIEALPRARVRARPRLAVAHAAAQIFTRTDDPAAVTTVLAEAEASLATAVRSQHGPAAASGDDELAELRGTLAAVWAAVATETDDFAAATLHGREALQTLPLYSLF